MSLFQCQNCGCCENTALANQGFPSHNVEYFSWGKIADRKNKRLCSACGPSTYKGGKPTKYGKWHGKFDRVFLPMGEFRTNQKGNLEHTKTGSEDFRSFAIKITQS